jgi:hypothetical protein
MYRTLRHKGVDSHRSGILPYSQEESLILSGICSTFQLERLSDTTQGCHVMSLGVIAT